jgi:two-component system, NtrC family, sensor kinase
MSKKGKKSLFGRFLDLPLRLKFTLSFLVVICFGGIITLTLGTRLEHQTIISLAQAKVEHDLDAAWMVYQEKINDIRDLVRVSAMRESLQRALESGDLDILNRYLNRVRLDFGLDVLTITNQKGIVVLRTSQPKVRGDDQSHDPVVAAALRGYTRAGTQIIPQKELLLEDKDLAQRAHVEILPTPKAAPQKKTAEKDGMVMKAASPLKNGRGEIIGVLYGGILLNHNYELVDRIKEIVYKDEKYKGQEIGTATIFQKDLRISTNVKNEQGERAIGTRVSQEVNQAVLMRGQPWIHRAFVVNDWYISAYRPIRNIHEEIIGILYVGMLEQPYIDLRNRVMFTFAVMAGISVVILLILMYISTSTIVHPLREMVTATKQIARGDLNHKVDISLQDEIGELAQSFNLMTENLKSANRKLVQWGKTLEKRVEERTKELKETQDSLIQSEKLASLGKMAAGIAHEINNPLTSILINTHLMLEKTGEENPFQENLTLVAEETQRCSNIVKGLLEFSRQSPPQKSLTDINALLEKTINLVKNQMAFQNIVITQQLTPDLPQTPVDAGQVKQVFLNLLVNAAEAMPEGGDLIVKSEYVSPAGNIRVVFQDTGHGIPEEHISNLFDPFYTTKSSGTGLGLALSYGILKQHQAEIHVESTMGKGSKFILDFPIPENKSGKPGERS